MLAFPDEDRYRHGDEKPPSVFEWVILIIAIFISYLIHSFKFLLAYFRLNKRMVCEMSKDCAADDDFHDYPDATLPYPLHFHTFCCARCGKEFTI